MKKLFHRRRRARDVEARLRAARPEPRPDFLRALTERVETGRSRHRLVPRPRLALAGALTAALLGALASFGGFGYAATAVQQAVEEVGSLLVSSHSSESSEAILVRGLTSGGDQYTPGFAWGDPSHNHAGAPGLVRAGGEFAPPLVARCTGKQAYVRTRIVLDEQADLRVSVLDPSGNRLLLTQRGSRVGGEVSGPQTKTIRYRVLVPRALRIVLRIPCGPLEEGRLYRIRILATDPSGLTSSLTIPFNAQGTTA